MEKFIASMRMLKKRPKEENCKLVWNYDPFFPDQNPWLITSFFSKKHIESRGMEVVYG